MVNDDPWAEHAYWFSGCQYVMHCKGQEFIARVQVMRTRLDVTKQEPHIPNVCVALSQLFIGFYISLANNLPVWQNVFDCLSLFIALGNVYFGTLSNTADLYGPTAHFWNAY